mmetsp:Transcript_47977/g.123442  ORF Transcript_47977/g.123442 Transcript_47977/m.123442 type:complete len:618 (+) Transcript_47977:2-1855(+)
MPTAGTAVRTPRNLTPRGTPTLARSTVGAAGAGSTTPRANSQNRTGAPGKPRLPDEARGQRRSASVAAATGKAAAGGKRAPSPGFGVERRSPSTATASVSGLTGSIARSRREDAQRASAASHALSPPSPECIVLNDELLEAFGPTEDIDAGTGGVSLSAISVGEEDAPCRPSPIRSGISTPRLVPCGSPTPLQPSSTRWKPNQDCPAGRGRMANLVAEAEAQFSRCISDSKSDECWVGSVVTNITPATSSSGISQVPGDYSLSEKSGSEGTDLHRRMEDLERCMAELAGENHRLRASLVSRSTLASRSGSATVPPAGLVAWGPISGSAVAAVPHVVRSVSAATSISIPSQVYGHSPAGSVQLPPSGIQIATVDGNGRFMCSGMATHPQCRAVQQHLAPAPSAPSLSASASASTPREHMAPSPAPTKGTGLQGNMTPPARTPTFLEPSRSLTPPRASSVNRSTSTPTFYQVAAPTVAPPWALEAHGEPTVVAQNFACAAATAQHQFAMGHYAPPGAGTPRAPMQVPQQAFAPGGLLAAPMAGPATPRGLPGQFAQAPGALAMPQRAHPHSGTVNNNGGDTVYAQLGEVLNDIRRKRSWSPMARPRRATCDTPPRPRMR